LVGIMELFFCRLGQRREPILARRAGTVGSVCYSPIIHGFTRKHTDKINS